MMVHSLSLGGMFCRCLLGPFGLQHLVNAGISLSSSWLEELFIGESGLLKSPTINV